MEPYNPVTFTPTMPPAFRVAPAVLKTAPPPIPLAFGWSQAYSPASNGGRKLLNMSQGVPGSPPDTSFISALTEVRIKRSNIRQAT